MLHHNKTHYVGKGSYPRDTLTLLVSIFNVTNGTDRAGYNVLVPIALVPGTTAALTFWTLQDSEGLRSGVPSYQRSELHYWTCSSNAGEVPKGE